MWCFLWATVGVSFRSLCCVTSSYVVIFVGIFPWFFLYISEFFVLMLKEIHKDLLRFFFVSGGDGGSIFFGIWVQFSFDRNDGGTGGESIIVEEITLIIIIGEALVLFSSWSTGLRIIINWSLKVGLGECTISFTK